jgi:hypothetical protein
MIEEVEEEARSFPGGHRRRRQGMRRREGRGSFVEEYARYIVMYD